MNYAATRRWQKVLVHHCLTHRITAPPHHPNASHRSPQVAQAATRRWLALLRAANAPRHGAYLVHLHRVTVGSQGKRNDGTGRNMHHLPARMHASARPPAASRLEPSKIWYSPQPIALHGRRFGLGVGNGHWALGTGEGRHVPGAVVMSIRGWRCHSRNPPPCSRSSHPAPAGRQRALHDREPTPDPRPTTPFSSTALQQSPRIGQIGKSPRGSGPRRRLSLRY